jgi:hypothetical protein
MWDMNGMRFWLVLVILRIWYVFATGNLTNKFNIFTVGLIRSYVDTLLCYFCTLSSIPLV